MYQRMCIADKSNGMEWCFAFTSTCGTLPLHNEIDSKNASDPYAVHGAG